MSCIKSFQSHSWRNGDYVVRWTQNGEDLACVHRSLPKARAFADAIRSTTDTVKLLQAEKNNGFTHWTAV